MTSYIRATNDEGFLLKFLLLSQEIRLLSYCYFNLKLYT